MHRGYPVYRETLLIGGDLNVQLTPLHPHIGHGTGALSPERAPDAETVHTLLSTHHLTALNTWSAPGSKANTFTFGKHQAQLDYLLVRISHSTKEARQAHPLNNCPVGGWRQGGGTHKPVVATLPFSYRIFHKPNKPAPQVDAEHIVRLAQTADPCTNPEVAQFRLEVQEKLASVNTVPEAGSISTIICDIAAKHFPKQTQSSSKIVRWQQPHVQEGIKDMWKAWRQYRSSTKDTTLRAILGRWKTWTRYNQLYTKHKERCRATKKTYILEQMCIAERAAQSHNQRLLYQVIRTLAPKARRSRPQLRDAQGHMMTRSEEATCFHQHFTTKFTATIEDLMKLDGLVFQPTNAVEEAPEGPLLHSSALEQHLNKAPLRKAVPQGHPPSAIWRLCSDITAAQICRVLDDKWCQRPTAVPQKWSDAHLVLLRKPAKTGKEAGHYRPIGLQDQLGKLTFKALVEPYQTLIYGLTTQYPQYGYAPGRSHRDALRRVFDHCAQVRAKCRAHRSTLHEKFEGTVAKTMVGGIQITIDLTGAFDAVPRHRLLEGMHRMQLPSSFIQLAICWHQHAHYHINHDGTDRVIHATQGVRQGCAVEPLLWLIFSHLISDALAAKIGYQATVDLLSIFADDYHCSGEFRTAYELEVTLERIAALLHTLAEMGMLVSPSKSKAIFRCVGPGAE